MSRKLRPPTPPRTSTTPIGVVTWSPMKPAEMGPNQTAGNTYSVPSRLEGERVRVRVYERTVEVHYGGERQLGTERWRSRVATRRGEWSE